MSTAPPSKKQCQRQAKLSSFFEQKVLSDMDKTKDGNRHEERQGMIGISESSSALESEASVMVSDNDIGHAVGKSLSDEDRVKFLDPWRPTSVSDFPTSVRKSDNKSKTGTERWRRLLPHHLGIFPWLGVSRCSEKAGAYCIPCVLFLNKCEVGGTSGHSQPSGKLVTLPLTQFDDLTGKNGTLTRHQSTRYHRQCVIDMENFKRIMINRNLPDIQSQLDEAHRKQVEENRNILRPIIDTVLLCARQNISLRGHRGESGAVDRAGNEPAENDGNFRSLLRFRIRGGDQMLEKHASSAKSNATYHSPEIQNALISAAAGLVKEKLMERMGKAHCWSILADETMDRQRREQLVVVIRYVIEEENSWHCYEDPIAVLDVYADIKANEQKEDDEMQLTGRKIAEILLRTTTSLGLNLKNCVGQGYDGASAFAGQRSGVAKQILQVSRNAHYFHCAMHCLNLSATKTCTKKPIRHAHEVVNDTVTFFRSSAKRSDTLKSIINDSEDADASGLSKSHLTKMCTTRFLERHTSIICFRSMMPYVMQSLMRMSNWVSLDTRKSAQTLINSITQPDTVVGLVILERISSIMLPTSRLLQTKDIDLTQAMGGIGAMLEALDALRSEDQFSLLFEQAKSLGDLLETPLTKPRLIPRSVYRLVAVCNYFLICKFVYIYNILRACTAFRT